MITYYDNFYGNLQLFFSHYHFWGFLSIIITLIYAFELFTSH